LTEYDNKNSSNNTCEIILNLKNANGEFSSNQSFNGSSNSNEISQIIDREKMNELFLGKVNKIEKNETFNKNKIAKYIAHKNSKNETPTPKKTLHNNFYKNSANQRNLRFSLNTLKSENIEHDDENDFSLIVEKNELDNENNLEDFLYRDYDLDNTNMNIVKNLDYGEEHKKMKNFQNILIERRPHYCILFTTNTNKENLINLSECENTLEHLMSTQKNYKEYKESVKYKYSHSMRKREDNNKSFTALHPYFNKIFETDEKKIQIRQKDSHLLYSNFIADIRKTCSNKEHDYLESITFNVKPFNNNEDLFQMEERSNEEDGSSNKEIFKIDPSLISPPRK
jgi:hypothetical protein